MKKWAMFAFALIFMSVFVLAEQSKLEITTIKEAYQPGEDITLKISLLDSQNNPLSSDVQVILENAAKTKKIESTVQSNKIVNLNLGEKATAGYWTATAKFDSLEVNTVFLIESFESAKFDISEDKLTITNIGNIPYAKEIQILIGDTLGTKKVNLEVGEQLTFRLLAPDGVYDVRVTDGKQTFTKTSVALTGNAIGVLDERLKANTPITGTRLGGDSDDSIFSLYKNSSFAYIFIMVLIGSAILLAIERNYSRLSKKHS